MTPAGMPLWHGIATSEVLKTIKVKMGQPLLTLFVPRVKKIIILKQPANSWESGSPRWLAVGVHDPKNQE